jgi:heme/copper-type cytochrome/quinol oxidase subunit 2
MSYHILHQFDEQWFADNVQEDDSSSRSLFGALKETHAQQRAERKSPQTRCWLIVIASLLVAACALYFALDARRQANDLQQRLSTLETKLKK